MPNGWRVINFNKEKDVEILRSVLDSKEKKLGVDLLRKKYDCVYQIQKKFVSHQFHRKINSLSETEARLAFEISKELFKILVKERVYPVNVSIVAHSAKGLYTI